MNQQDFRYLSKEHSHWMIKAHTEPSKSKGIGDIVEHRTIGPLSLQGKYIMFFYKMNRNENTGLLHSALSSFTQQKFIYPVGYRDLTPLDFLLWSYLKSRRYIDRLQN